MAFTLPDLPYAYNALEPYIDEQTMRLHHDKHHATYVNNLNTALKDTPFADLPVDEVLRRINEVPANVKQAVINNGGGHSNHSMFWQIMGPNGGGEPPAGALANAINSAFGTFDAFKTAFNDAGAKRFGSGWAWLILDASGKLQVIST
ncbi:MAG: superoxide dismutase, partial [Ktedonobacteraceae bacterium]|nr:superoxide dismutase [Ktedonobacteraceae bacterium]